MELLPKDRISGMSWKFWKRIIWSNSGGIWNRFWGGRGIVSVGVVQFRDFGLMKWLVLALNVF